MKKLEDVILQTIKDRMEAWIIEEKAREAFMKDMINIPYCPDFEEYVQPEPNEVIQLEITKEGERKVRQIK